MGDSCAARSHAERRRFSPAIPAAVIGAALLLRIIAVYAIEWRPWFDDDWYFRTAVEIASGKGYLNEHGRPTAFFPVGYPGTLAVVLSVAGVSLRNAQLLNVALSTATMLCIYALARQCALNARVAGLAAVLFGFLPNQILSCCVTMSEITFTFVLTLGIFLCARSTGTARWDVLVGLVFGWAMLVRPQALFVPFILIPVIAHLRDQRRAWDLHNLKRMAVVGIAMAAVVAPWTYRNYKVFDAFVLVSSNGGENLLIGNNPASTQSYSPPASFYPKDVHLPSLPELERDRLGASLAKAYLKSHPIEALLKAPKKVWYMYRSDLGVTNWLWAANNQTGTPIYYACQAVTQSGYMLVLLAGLLWIFRTTLRRNENTAERMFLGVSGSVIGYFTLLTMVFFGDARYHQPVMPLFAIAAALCITTISRRSRRV